MLLLGLLAWLIGSLILVRVVGVRLVFLSLIAVVVVGLANAALLAVLSNVDRTVSSTLVGALEEISRAFIILILVSRYCAQRTLIEVCTAMAWVFVLVETLTSYGGNLFQLVNFVGGNFAAGLPLCERMATTNTNEAIGFVAQVTLRGLIHLELIFVTLLGLLSKRAHLVALGVAAHVLLNLGVLYAATLEHLSILHVEALFAVLLTMTLVFYRRSASRTLEERTLW